MLFDEERTGFFLIIQFSPNIGELLFSRRKIKINERHLSLRGNYYSQK